MIQISPLGATSRLCKVCHYPTTLFSLEHCYGCCNGNLQVRDELRVDCIPYLQGIPKKKISCGGGVKSGECRDNSKSHLWLISLPGKRYYSNATVSFGVWGVAPSCRNCWKALRTHLHWPSSAENLLSTCTVWGIIMIKACPLMSLNQNGPMKCSLKVMTQVVHFAQYDKLSGQCSGNVLPHKTFFHVFFTSEECGRVIADFVRREEVCLWRRGS